jgi:hypothetical protein
MRKSANRTPAPSVTLEEPLPPGPVVLKYAPAVPDVGSWVVVDDARKTGTVRFIGRVVSTSVGKTRLVICLVDKTLVLPFSDTRSCWHYLTAPEQSAICYLDDVIKILREQAMFAPTQGARRRIVQAILALQTG